MVGVSPPPNPNEVFPCEKQDFTTVTLNHLGRTRDLCIRARRYDYSATVAIAAEPDHYAA